MINKIKDFLGIFCNYRMVAILLLGFSAGIPLALTGSVLSMWLSRLGIDVKTIGLFALVAVPYSFKYLWSSIFDYVPLPYLTKKLGLRRGWLICSQILLMISIIALGTSSPAASITITAILAVLVSFSSATQDIIIDAFRIEVLNTQEQGLGATMYVYGYRIAMLVSGAGSLLLSDYFSWNVVYLIMSMNILIGILAVMFLPEPTHSEARIKKIENFKITFNSCLEFFKNAKWFHFTILAIIVYKILDKIFVSSSTCNSIFLAIVFFILYWKQDAIIAKLPEPIKDFSKREHWLVILLFIIFYKVADTLIATVQSKFYVTMGFSNSEVAYITKGFGFMMTLLGLFAGGLIYYRFKTFKSLFLAGILQIVSNFVFIWVAKEQHNVLALTVAIAVENFTSAINNVVIVAYLSSLCNIAYTATQYALLSSLSSVGRTIISAPAGYIVDSFGWEQFFCITAVAGIPSLILLYIIFRKDFKHVSA